MKGRVRLQDRQPATPGKQSEDRHDGIHAQHPVRHLILRLITNQAVRMKCCLSQMISLFSSSIMRAEMRGLSKDALRSTH